ncbi:MAG TPA: hypothetical protein VM617_01200, partial [Thermoanaerobaculia bacterium]|nr:hypothetical protein [Thermoanaerobaculia bacterium]
FAAAHLAGRGLDGLVTSTIAPRRARAVGAGVLLLLLVELAPRPIPWHSVPRTAPPAVTLWLAGADEVAAVLHLPLAEEPIGEIPRMDLATIHRRPIVNGFSGHFPSHWVELRRICCWPVPDDQALARLRLWGVTHLVIHPRWQRRWQGREFRTWTARVAEGEVPGVEKVWEDPASGDTVFRIDAGARSRTRSPDVANPRR